MNIEKGTMQFFCNSLYNTWQVAESVNSEYEQLILMEVSVLSDTRSVFMDVGVHGHKFRSAYQFKTR